MHILYLYQFYNSPDCYTTAKHYWFIRYLVEQGHKISLITSDHFRNERITNEFEWLPEGVEVVHIPVSYSNEIGIARRGLAFLKYMSKAFIAGLRMEEPDVVFGISTPLTTAWIARQIARIKRVPWVFEVKDLWPLVPIEVGAIKSKAAQKALYRAERNLYESAAHIVSLSPGMTEYIENTGTPQEKVTTIVNGTDYPLIERVTETELDKLRSEHDLHGKKVVLYGGKYGRMNGIPTMIQAVEQLAHRDDLRFVFVGYGYYNDAIDELASRQNNVVSISAKPKYQMFPWFKLADISLFSVIGAPSLGTASPSKVFDSLACGAPLIMINKGWATDLVLSERVGFATPPADADGLARTIEESISDEAELQAMSERGIALAARDYDRRDHVRRLEAIFEAVVAGTPVAIMVSDVDKTIRQEKEVLTPAAVA